MFSGWGALTFPGPRELETDLLGQQSFQSPACVSCIARSLVMRPTSVESLFIGSLLSQITFVESLNFYNYIYLYKDCILGVYRAKLTQLMTISMMLIERHMKPLRIQILIYVNDGSRSFA